MTRASDEDASECTSALDLESVAKRSIICTMDVFSAFVAVIERLIQLLSTRARGRRELFKEIVDPLYIQLRPVAEEYYAMLCSTRDALELSKARDVAEVTAELRSRRDHILLVRASVMALVEEVGATSTDPHLLSLCKKVSYLFQNPPSKDDGLRSMSPTRYAIVMLESVLDGTCARQDTIEFLSQAIIGFRTRWIAVAEAHAAFMLRSLTKGAM